MCNFNFSMIVELCYQPLCCATHKSVCQMLHMYSYNIQLKVVVFIKFPREFHDLHVGHNFAYRILTPFYQSK